MLSFLHSSSDAEFYKNLQKISGKDVLNDEDGESEEEDLSDDAARRLAEDIGDLDDLDNDLFAGLNKNNKINNSSKKGKTELKKGFHYFFRLVYLS